MSEDTRIEGGDHITAPGNSLKGSASFEVVRSSGERASVTMPLEVSAEGGLFIPSNPFQGLGYEIRYDDALQIASHCLDATIGPNGMMIKMGPGMRGVSIQNSSMNGGPNFRVRAVPSRAGGWHT